MTKRTVKSNILKSFWIVESAKNGCKMLGEWIGYYVKDACKGTDYRTCKEMIRFIPDFAFVIIYRILDYWNETC